MLKNILALLFIAVMCLACIWLSFYINYVVLYDTFIGEDCEHNSPNIIFNLFFDINSNTGFHPEPSMFYYMFVIALGFLTGIYLSNIVLKRFFAA